MNAFYQQVYDIVSQIPRGKVVSYGQIARVLCRPRAAREVGRAMRFCPPELPWQRVVKQDGSIAAGGDPELRRQMLEDRGRDPSLPDGRVDYGPPASAGPRA